MTNSNSGVGASVQVKCFTMGDEYMEVNSKEYRLKPRSQVYSLPSLDDDFLQHFMPYLQGKDEHDLPIRSTRTGTDVIDARGYFSRKEVTKKLCNLRQSELEGQLGISSPYKVDQILKRAEQRTRSGLHHRRSERGQQRKRQRRDITRLFSRRPRGHTRAERTLRRKG